MRHSLLAPLAGLVLLAPAVAWAGGDGGVVEAGVVALGDAASFGAIFAAPAAGLLGIAVLWRVVRTLGLGLSLAGALVLALSFVAIVFGAPDLAGFHIPT
ncbi:MAG: hypothetical protein R3D33_14000 [Hyphomicrobiaceae bacterium]